MEADWEFEVGGDAPVITSVWPGLVDLQRFPERVTLIAEAAQLPGLAEALVRLNAISSQVWTSKCDVWPVVDSAQFDADELDAPRGFATHAIACYIDLLSRSEQRWPGTEQIEESCKGVCIALRAVPLRCARVDLVVRRAYFSAKQAGFGITAYLTACGASEIEAVQTLEIALAAFADAFCTTQR
jgi:hypothetical protein